MTKIRFTISEGGHIKQQTISILEDLLHDYQYSIEQALLYKEEVDKEFLSKRYERMAFISLVTYLDGVINRWLKITLDEAEWKKISHKSTSEKFEELDKLFELKKKKVFLISIDRYLRNELIHFADEKDFKIYDGINATRIMQLATRIDSWLDKVEKIIGIPRHINTKKLANELKISGEVLGEEYSGEDDNFA